MNPEKPMAYNGKDPYIFISYAHKDSERILPIIAGLQKRGFRVWYDEGLEVGSSWGDMIEEHLYNCCCTICFITDHFLHSENCRDEIDYAKEIGKGPLIIYMEELELPRSFMFRYNRFHALKYTDFPDLDRFLDKLSSTTQLTECMATPAHFNVPRAQPVKPSTPVMATPVVATPTVSPLEPTPPPEVDYEKQYTLASNFHFGLNGPQNRKEALRLFRDCAEHGHTASQDWLGRYYYEGWVVPQDLHEAMKWFTLAAAQKYAPAQLHKQLCQDKLSGKTVK